MFTHFIAESQRQQFLHSMSGNIFFSFLMDGSTDCSNIGVEFVLVVFCKKDDSVSEVQTRTRYLALVKPDKGTADGLLLRRGSPAYGC